MFNGAGGQIVFISGAEDSTNDDSSFHIPFTDAGMRAYDQYMTRGDSRDLEACIEPWRVAMELLPDEAPEKANVLGLLGAALHQRSMLTGSSSDSEEGITFEQISNALTPDDSPDKPSRLGNLGTSFFNRFQREEKIDDLEEAVTLLTSATDLMPSHHHCKPAFLNNLGCCLHEQFVRTGNIREVEAAIAFGEQAVQLTPDNHPGKPLWLENLASSFAARFGSIGDLEDLEKSIALNTRSIALAPDGHPHKPSWLNNLAASLIARNQRLGNVEDIEKAILLASQAVEKTPDSHRNKMIYLGTLGNSLEVKHIAQVGKGTEDLRRAIHIARRAIELTSDDTSRKADFFDSLGRRLQKLYNETQNLDDLDDAIKAHTSCVELMPQSISAKLYNLSEPLRVRFHRTNNTEDLEEAIKHSSRAIELLPANHPHRTALLRRLGGLFRTRMISSQGQNVEEDLARALNALSGALQHSSGDPMERLQSGREYIDLLSIAQPHMTVLPQLTVLQAHEHLLHLIPRIVWLGNTVDRRYEELVKVGTIASRAAADAIAAGEYSQALEWLESGRAVVWSQVLQLNTPLLSLQQSHPTLASHLRQVSRALQQSANAHLDPISLVLDRGRPRTSLENEAKSSHSIAVEYQKLIDQIRGLQGFEDFLRPKKLAQLKGACASSHIVVINMHESRCDALVLSQHGGLKHIPLPTFPHDLAKRLHNQLWSVLDFNGLVGRFRDGLCHDCESEGDERGVRRHGGQHDPMYGILNTLWSAVVKPVIDFIRTLPSSETSSPLPHVTWLPTGPLTFLPLHAAGVYNANGEPTETVMDFVVSSYTPTLDALLHPRSRVIASHDYPRVLVVSQPDTPGYDSIPGTTTEAAIVASLLTQPADVFDDVQGTVNAVLDGMATHDWVHLACHGMQNRQDPTESSFALYDGQLTLKTLMLKHLTNVDLAVLSACQTATGDVKLSEEAVHLVAGMLNVGYKSVIGTMWSIRDDSAPTVMSTFYETLVKQMNLGEELRPAYALHEATRALRQGYGVNSFLRWVPFVHFGL